MPTYTKKSIKPPQYEFTKTKFLEIKQKLTSLQVERKEAVVELSEARAMGDLSENGRYKAARQNLSRIDSAIRRHQQWIQFGKEIAKPAHGSSVTLGSSVTIEQNGKTRIYEIVSKLEADPLAGKVSNDSPIGKALLGHRKGDTVSILAPRRTLSLVIISVD